MIAAALRAARALKAPRQTPGLVVLVSIAMLLAWDASGFDLPLAQAVGTAHGFAWRDHWLLTSVLHDGGRQLSWALALALCLGVWWPAGPLARLPAAQRLQLAVSTLVAAFAVSLLKGLNATSCPWDLHLFGGVAQYVSHWSRLADGGPGHCFPAGHAASGFAFLGGWFAFRRHDPHAARWWLLAALGTGGLLGISQQLRGAHFMSHTLWTAWICWTCAWILDGLHRHFAVTEL